MRKLFNRPFRKEKDKTFAQLLAENPEPEEGVKKYVIEQTILSASVPLIAAFVMCRLKDEIHGTIYEPQTGQTFELSLTLKNNNNGE